MMREDLLTFVYAIRCGDWIKIGVASNIESRMGAMRTNCPYPLALVGSRRFPNASAALRVEKLLHQELAGQRHMGEWFRTGPIDPVAAIGEAYRREGLEPVNSAIDLRKAFTLFPEMPKATYDDIYPMESHRT